MTSIGSHVLIQTHLRHGKLHIALAAAKPHISKKDIAKRYFL